MHILIVEDDPVVADVLGMTLEEAGHFQSTAHNIETALADYMARDGRCDELHRAEAIRIHPLTSTSTWSAAMPKPYPLSASAMAWAYSSPPSVRRRLKRRLLPGAQLPSEVEKVDPGARAPRRSGKPTVTP